MLPYLYFVWVLKYWNCGNKSCSSDLRVSLQHSPGDWSLVSRILTGLGSSVVGLQACFNAYWKERPSASVSKLAVDLGSYSCLVWWFVKLESSHENAPSMPFISKVNKNRGRKEFRRENNPQHNGNGGHYHAFQYAALRGRPHPRFRALAETLWVLSFSTLAF